MLLTLISRTSIQTILLLLFIVREIYIHSYDSRTLIYVFFIGIFTTSNMWASQWFIYWLKNWNFIFTTCFSFISATFQFYIAYLMFLTTLELHNFSISVSFFGKNFLTFPKLHVHWNYLGKFAVELFLSDNN